MSDVEKQKSYENLNPETKSLLRSVTKWSLEFTGIIGLILMTLGVLITFFGPLIATDISGQMVYPFLGKMMVGVGIFTFVQGVILVAANEIFKAILSIDESMKITVSLLSQIKESHEK